MVSRSLCKTSGLIFCNQQLMPATRQWSSKLVVEPHCSCGPESTPSDLTGYWRGLPPLWRPRKVRHFRQAGRLNPMRGSMQMILLTTWSGYLAKWTLPSHPGVSPMWNSLARNSSRSFSDPSASCQPEQALEELRLNMIEHHNQPVGRWPNMKFEVFELPVGRDKQKTRKTPYRFKIAGSRSPDPTIHSHDGLYICVQTVGCQNFCNWTFKCIF